MHGKSSTSTTLTKLLPVIFIFLLPALASAAGKTTGDYLLVDILARETALGGIYAPYYAKAGASIINPAVLAGIENNQMIISHYSSVFGTNYEQALFAMMLGQEKYMSAHFMYDSTPGLERTDADGKPVEQIENFDVVTGVSYAMTFNKEYNVGAGLKFTASKIYKSTSFGGLANLGLLYRNFERRYMIGAVVENLGISSALFKEDAMYPMLVRAGYGTEIYRDTEAQAYLAALYIEERVYLNENEGTETSFGLEVTYMKFFTFRYGYVFGRDEGRIALGAGFKVNSVYIDYAYQPFFISDNAHRITLTVKFE